MDIIDNIERMEKPFDPIISRMSKNQLLVLRYMLGRADSVVPSREIAKKTGIVEKALGGVLSALSRKVVDGEHLMEVMGRDGAYGLRFRLNSKAITVVLAEKQVRALLASYK